MSKFKSKFGYYMEQFLKERESHGYSNSVFNRHLKTLDSLCHIQYPNEIHLNQEIVLSWLEKRPNEGIGGQKSRASIIRVFAKYLCSQHQLAYILPTKFIGGQSSFTPYILSDDELSRLFKAIDQRIPNNKKYPYCHLILPVYYRLTYTCGLRPSEGRLIKKTDVNLNTQEILITKAKHHKERIVVMSDDMANLCKIYESKLKIFAPTSEYFFPSIIGNAISDQWFEDQFHKCWIAANPNIDTLPNVRIYDLRHRFATTRMHLWIDENQDLTTKIPYLRAYMGHTSFNYTMHYIHLLPENLVKSSNINWKALSEVIPEVEPW
jgi:integrase